jgi:uncharacterized protein YecE (DUF72 family)
VQIELKSGIGMIGTSGWSYRSWQGPMFPKDRPARSHLEYYAQQFRTIEPNPSTLEKWARWLQRMNKRGRGSCVNFDNDQKNAALKDALRLIEFISGSHPKLAEGTGHPAAFAATP